MDPSKKNVKDHEILQDKISTQNYDIRDNHGWQSPLQRPCNRLLVMYILSKFTDLTITFPGHSDTLKVHRLVLAMSSPVFECMLFGPMAEGEELKLPEDPPEAFKWLIQYIYGGTTNLPSVSIAVQVYHLASRYQMKALSTLCSQHLQKNLNGENLPFIYDTATLLEDVALQKACSNVVKLSADSVFSSGDIGQLSRESLKHLLQQDMTVTSEVSVFRGVLKWAKTHGSGSAEETEEGKRVREDIEEFLLHVRFLTMSLDEFVEHVIPSNILTNEESISILMNMKKVKNIPLPIVCSREEKKRIAFDWKYVHKTFLFQKINFGLYNSYNNTNVNQEIIRDMIVSKEICLGRISFTSSYILFNQTWKVEVTDLSNVVLGVASENDPQNASRMSATDSYKLVATFDPPVLMTSEQPYNICVTCFQQEKYQDNIFTSYRNLKITGCICSQMDIEIQFWCFDDSL